MGKILKSNYTTEESMKIQQEISEGLALKLNKLTKTLSLKQGKIEELEKELEQWKMKCKEEMISRVEYENVKHQMEMMTMQLETLQKEFHQYQLTATMTIQGLRQETLAQCGKLIEMEQELHKKEEQVVSYQGLVKRKGKIL